MLRRSGPPEVPALTARPGQHKGTEGERRAGPRRFFVPRVVDLGVDRGLKHRNGAGHFHPPGLSGRNEVDATERPKHGNESARTQKQ